MTWLTAQKPTPIADADRTKLRRDMPSLARNLSAASSWTAITLRCSADGGGGMNSPLDAGSTSSGMRSERFDHRSRCRRTQSLIEACLLSVSADDFEGAAHAGVHAAVEG